MTTVNGEVDITAGHATNGTDDINAAADIDIDAVSGATINVTGANKNALVETANGEIQLKAGDSTNGSVIVDAAADVSIDGAGGVSINASGSDLDLLSTQGEVDIDAKTTIKIDSEGATSIDGGTGVSSFKVFAVDVDLALCRPASRWLSTC